MPTFRDIQLGYDPGAQLNFTRQQSQQVGQSVPDTDLSQQILDLLKHYQQFGRSTLGEAQHEQARRLGAETPQSLIGASPSVQSGVRQAQVSALQPTIGGARERLTLIKDAIDEYRSAVLEKQQAEDRKQDKAFRTFNTALNAGSKAIEGILKQQPDLLKDAGLTPETAQAFITAKREEEQQKLKESVGGLTPGQINATINQIRSNFDNEQIVKDYNSILGQVNFARTAEKTPTDDISRIYVFAKIMDPNSVVREGEYATVQQYAQTLLQRYGLGAIRAFDNRGFLTDQARKFLLNTIERRLKVSEEQYNNLAKEYQRQIDDVRVGKPPVITQYSIPQAAQPPAFNPSEWEHTPDTSQTQTPRFSSGTQTTTPSFTRLFK